MGLTARKPVFRVSDKVRFKPVTLAKETSYEIEITLIAGLDMILSNKQATKALIRLRRCPGWSAPLLVQTSENRFSCVKAHLLSIGWNSEVQILGTLHSVFLEEHLHLSGQ